jgi:hypothetical protein
MDVRGDLRGRGESVTVQSPGGRAHRAGVTNRSVTSAETVAWPQHSQRRDLIGADRDDPKNLPPQFAEARDWQ